MKKNIYMACAMTALIGLSACNDDEIKIGNPNMDFTLHTEDGYFGDSIPFTIRVSDNEVPLSTLKAQLYYGDEKVSETIIRTKESDREYSGKVLAPFRANIANGKATIKYTLQNINFTLTEAEQTIALMRADYPYLILVGEDGKEYQMERKELYQYEVTQKFPQEMPGYIKTPKAGDNGNEICFGMQSGAIKEGSKASISFSSPEFSGYTIAFNTMTYEASPFTKMLINGNEFVNVDGENFYLDMTVKQEQTLTLSGVPDYDNWWIDADYFEKQTDGTLQFKPINGSYRILANSKMKCFSALALKDGEPATLQQNGTGAIWVIGDGVGKPSVAAKEVGWTTENGLCMAPIGAGKYQITLVAGRSIKADNINFKFFHQQGWGGEFSGTTLTTDNPWIGVGTGADGHDNGNLYLKEGVTLQMGFIYKFVVDVSAGISNATLSVTNEGEMPVEIKNITFGGVKMESADGEIYTARVPMTQHQTIAISGIDNLQDYWINPDYFTYQEGALQFIPVDGDYKITINTVQQFFAINRVNGNADAVLNDDGTGAIWMMGWGVGSPSLDNQFGWTPGAAYCMPEVSPKVYRFTAVAGPENGSSLGQRIRFDYLSCKFFFQNGWGGEFTGGHALTIASGSEAYIADNGNIELAAGVQLEQGATYIMTVDLSKGNNQGVLSFVKK